MKTILTLFILFTALNSFAQIKFVDNIGWEEASRRAKAEKKLVFLHLEDSKCQQCSDVATQGFASAILKEKFEQNFISLRANVETERGSKLMKQFEVKQPMVSLFIDPDGNILNRHSGTTSAGFIYAEQADIALSRRGGKKLSDFEKEYKSGKRSPEFLKEYMAKRKELSQPVDDLLDVYVGQLVIDSLRTFPTVKYIYMQGPTMDSRAYRLIQAVAEFGFMDSLYKASSYEERTAMNGAIINSTFRKAVDKKDVSLAYQASGFIQNGFGKDYAKGQLSSNRSIARFFYSIKDTASFISQASMLVENSLIKVSLDSLKRMDDYEMKHQTFSQPAVGQQQPLNNTFRFAPPSQHYHIELNENAWHFFEMANQKDDLERALRWSEQSIFLFDELNKDKNHPMKLGNPAYLDTYAQLLYKLGRKAEAIKWQTKAVEAQKITGNSAGSLEETLSKMKAGK